MGTRQEALDAQVRARFADSKAQREDSRTCIYHQRPLTAEPDAARAANVARRMGAESIQDDTIDFLPSWFLSLGARRSKAVCILRSARNTPVGTGFLISPRLLITNHHVLDNELVARSSVAEFDYAEDDQALAMTPTRFALRPDLFWWFSDTLSLDFAIVAVGDRLSGAATLDQLGFLPLSDRPDKHALGLHANVVQHPLGRRRQVVVRENRLLARDRATERCLHYSADTEEGSSGSPVFNDAWEVVALHHWGIPQLDTVNVNGIAVPVTVNEGIRTSVIVGQLRQDLPRLPPDMAPLLREAMDLGENVSAGAAPPRVPGTPPLSAPAREPGPLPGPPRAERIRRDTNYANRQGFQADFIEGVEAVLADIVRPRAAELAPLLDGRSGTDAVLDYQHFSLLICQARRLAFLTATNIDASRYVAIDRETGEPRLGPEGESWYDDERMDPANHLGQAWYSDWSNYFDRGHLTRRTDPTWGTERQAIRANADTYHRTNCAPQHFRFNQSIRFWQGLERYVLEHGVLKTRSRITVFNGPVLDDGYSECDDVQVPLAFWKLLLRTGPDGAPRASAYMASQETLLEEVRRYVARPQDSEVPRVDAFRCAIPRLADLTGLDFSAFAPFDTFRKKRGPEGMDSGQSRMADWSDAL